MPDIVVVGPDGNRYVFPEGTSRDVMRQAMQKRFPQPQAKQRTPSRLEAFGAGIGEAIPRAITRMKRSVSETEFVKAAREFQGIIQSALDRAAQREAKLKGTAPAGARRTPVQKGASKELRFNPATGDFE